MNVNVIGFGRAVRMDLEEVFVNAELVYHMMHKTCSPSQLIEGGTSLFMTYNKLDGDRSLQGFS